MKTSTGTLPHRIAASQACARAEPAAPCLAPVAPGVAPAERVYHGHTDPLDPRGGFVVQVETIDGVRIRPLRHVRRHSPDGFAWGYAGSGPADLARSLLLDALEDEGHCPGCSGSGRIVVDQETGREQAYNPAPARRPKPPLPTPQDETPDAMSGSGTARTLVLTCWACRGDGATTVPYHAFKEAVVAHLGPEWRLTRSEILAWMRCDA